MTTQEHVPHSESEDAVHSAVAFGYAVIAVSGLMVGLVIAWLV